MSQNHEQQGEAISSNGIPEYFKTNGIPESYKSIGSPREKQWAAICKERQDKDFFPRLFRRALDEALGKLGEDETLLWVETAQMKEKLHGVLLLTDKRVVVECKGVRLSEYHSIDLKDLDTISIERKRYIPALVVTSPGKRLEIKCAVETDKTIEKITSAMAAAKSHGAPSMQAPSTPSLADQIRDLGQLRDEGLITEDEFLEQKSKLLEQS